MIYGLKHSDFFARFVSFLLVREHETDMPYGYYEFIRFIALIGFVYLSYKSYEEGSKGLCFIYAALAILFQPLFKIYLGRAVWNIIDVIAGIFFISTILYPNKKAAWVTTSVKPWLHTCMTNP